MLLRVSCGSLSDRNKGKSANQLDLRFQGNCQVAWCLVMIHM